MSTVKWGRKRICVNFLCYNGYVSNHRFKAAIRIALRIRGWSHEELARYAGVSKGTVGNFLSKPNRDILLGNAAQIARTLGLSLDAACELDATTDHLSPAEAAAVALLREAGEENASLLVEMLRNLVATLGVKARRDKPQHFGDDV